MLYNSIIFLIFCILLLIFAYKYRAFEQFAATSGYVEDPTKIEKIRSDIIKSDIEFNEFKKGEGARREALAAEIKSLKKRMADQIRTANIKNCPTCELDLSQRDIEITQSFDSKELYSILVNTLSITNHTKYEKPVDHSVTIDNSDKFKFTTVITDTIDVACRLLQQKQDYKYITDCVKTTRGPKRIGNIHILITTAYNYINHPKFNSTTKLNGYLIGKFSDNIKELILLGRRIILEQSNVCQCAVSKSTGILQRQMQEFKQSFNVISQQEKSIKASLRKNSRALPSWAPNANFMGMNIPRVDTDRLTNKLTQLAEEKSGILNKLIEYGKKIETIEKSDEWLCKPC